MPVATFAEFVAEQAVAIALGAAAVVVAPKAGPKLAELGGDLRVKVKAMTDATSSSAAAGAAAESTSTRDGEPAAAATAAAATVAAAGRGLAARLSGGVQKLGQQWTALKAEAEGPGPGPATPGLADALAGVTAANVVSFAPGRARLRLRALRGQPPLAAQLEQALAAVDGVRQAQASPTTGSVLITFDAKRYPSPESLLDPIAQL